MEHGEIRAFAGDALTVAFSSARARVSSKWDTSMSIAERCGMKRSPCGREAGVRPRLGVSSSGALAALDGSRAAVLRLSGVPCMAFMHSSYFAGFIALLVVFSAGEVKSRWERYPRI